MRSPNGVYPPPMSTSMALSPRSRACTSYVKGAPGLPASLSSDRLLMSSNISMFRPGRVLFSRLIFWISGELVNSVPERWEMLLLDRSTLMSVELFRKMPSCSSEMTLLDASTVSSLRFLWNGSGEMRAMELPDRLTSLSSARSSKMWLGMNEMPLSDRSRTSMLVRPSRSPALRSAVLLEDASSVPVRAARWVLPPSWQLSTPGTAATMALRIPSVRLQMPSVLVWAWALWCGVPDAAAVVMAAASMRNTRMAAVSPLGREVIAFCIFGIIDALLDVGVGNQGPGADAGVSWKHRIRSLFPQALSSGERSSCRRRLNRPLPGRDYAVRSSRSWVSTRPALFESSWSSRYSVAVSLTGQLATVTRRSA